MSGFRLFKTTYKDRHGHTREASALYVEFRDHNERPRRLPAFTSKAASDEMGRNLVKLVAYHKGSGGQTDPSLARWLAGLPMRTREKLTSIGLLNREHAAVAKPLSEHVADWSKALEAKGNTLAYVALAVGRVQKIIDGCTFKYFSEMTGAKVAG